MIELPQGGEVTVRSLLSILVTWGLAASCSLSLAEAGDSLSQSFSPSVEIDTVAQEIFSQADKNHNDYLSKIEFARAHAALVGQVEAWGYQGLIGKPLKGKSKARSHGARGVSLDVVVAGDKLARSNKVTLAEFTHFAHAILADADGTWRQMHADQAIQRKAASQQRKALNADRGAGHLQGHTVFGIPF